MQVKYRAGRLRELKERMGMYFIRSMMHYVKKGMYILIDTGPAGLFMKINAKLRSSYPRKREYTYWIDNHEPSRQELEKQMQSRFGYEPRMSIVVTIDNAPATSLSETSALP